MTLTLWGHKTSSVTWTVDALFMVSCMCSFQNIIIAEILRVKHLAKLFPMYLARLLRYWASKFGGHDLDFLGPRDVIDHVTVELLICSFLQMILWNHCSISHRCWDIMCQTLSQAYSRWKCTDPHFCVLGAELGVTAFCNFVLVAASWARRLSS